MLKTLRLLFALAFIVHGLTAQSRVLCYAPGPDGHTRVEFAFMDCCKGHAAHDTAAPSSDSSCAVDPDCCGDCHDEKLIEPGAVRPSSNPVVLPVVCLVPSSFCIQDVVAPFSAGPSASDHPGDPPLFLTHCNFRI